MRRANRIWAALLAAALMVGGIVAVVEIVLAATDNRYWVAPWRTWRRWAIVHDWAATPVAVASLCLCAAGLLLFLLAVLPQRPDTVPVTPRNDDIRTAVHRRSLVQSLRRDAERIDGIAGAKVRLSRRAVRVMATSHRRDVSGLEERVRQAVERRLSGLDLRGSRRVQVDLKGGKPS